MDADASSGPGPVVLKIGGSVLTGLPAYRRAAEFISAFIAGNAAAGLVAVVSAENGHTDRLADEARALADHRRGLAGSLSPTTADGRAPADTPGPDALDLLWSTGEHRSVALLTLALRAAGVAAAPLNAHQINLLRCRATPDAASRVVLRAALATHDVVVVPGFLGIRAQQLVTIGRGGSDLTAVLLATSLAARSCVLIKDVDGYFTADPAADRRARHIPSLSFAAAIDLAGAGCPLVQREALVAAASNDLTLVVRSITGGGTTVSRSSSLAVTHS